MKRTERHHLKDNELGLLARQARDLVEARKRGMGTAIAAIVIVGAAALGWVAWREHTQSLAHGLLADAESVMETRVGAPIPPGMPGAGPSFPTETDRLKAALAKFKAAADAYPATDAGVFARYQEGATDAALGNAADAARAYQLVIDHGADGILGQMARLGLAEAQARGGQYDKAIEAFKELALRKEGPLPVDGILLQLGRAYRDAGRREDAQQTFNRIVTEFPDSAFSADAKRELDNLRRA
jgi:tetratricopeptide (TPR) repeat protein